MCESGINVNQMKLSVAQVDDTLALAQQWLEQLHHLCDRGGQSAASAHLAQVTVMLGEARGRLGQAGDDLGGGSGRADQVTVERL